MAWWVLGMSGVTAGGLGYGLWERRRLQVTRYLLRHPRWPAQLGGWRVVHLSDLHVKQLTSYERTVLDRVNQLRPDLVCITGDLVEHRAGIQGFIDFARGLQAPGGAWAVFGNREVRDHFPLADFAWRLEKGSPVRVLRNEAASAPQSQGLIWVVGVEIPNLHVLFQEGRRQRRALGGNGKTVGCLWREELATTVPHALSPVPSEAFRIGLVHTPDMFPTLLEGGVELGLAGHTHGGQVRLPGGYAPTPHVFYAPRHWFEGLHRVEGGWVLISRGVGTSNLPLRFGCRPELVVVDIEWGPELHQRRVDVEESWHDDGRGTEDAEE